VVITAVKMPSIMKLLMSSALAACLLLPAVDGSAAQVLRVALMDDLQPWVFLEQGAITGVYPELIRDIARRTDREVLFLVCPVKRCEMWLRRGDVDMVIGLRDTTDRREYMEFLSTPYRYGSPKVFYLRRGETGKLRKYEDLYAIRIGTQLGTKYFEPFDSDTRIRKDEVVKEELSFPKLLHGRIDAVVIPEDRGEYFISKLGCRDRVEKARFRHADGTPRFIGVSRKGSALKDLSLFNKTMRDIAADGTLGCLYRDHFFRRFQVPEGSIKWK
jgi:polar amino acid transport system substrate-binding protein